jgi:tetratricopeptide (TPR) repeat protein
MEAVNHLLEFEKRGIPTITPKPSEFISHFAGKRDQLESFCSEPNGKPDQTTTEEKVLSEAEAIGSLEELCNELTKVTPDKPPLSQSKIDEVRSKMDKTISEIEKQFPKGNSQELEYMLGVATLLYTEWFIRGDERKQYLQRAVEHVEKIEECETANVQAEDYESRFTLFNGTNDVPIKSSKGEDAFTAWTTGFNLDINEEIRQDLEKFISYLEPIYNNTEDYRPIYGHYVDAYRSLGNYEKAIKLGLELHHRAENTKKFGNTLKLSGTVTRGFSIERRFYMSSLSTAPMNTVAKSYRSMAKDCKKKGETEQAISLFEKLVNTGLATDNDKKLLAKLQTLEKNR